MQEHAIAIARVSQKKQRPEDQRPELAAYAERKDYILDEVVPVHGRSAFHGRHVKYILAAVEKYVRHGNATVVIFRHVDRSSRQGVYEGFDLLKRIMDAGARVEFSEQEYLSEQPGMIGLFFDLAQKESQIKKDRKEQGNRVKRQKGELIGKVPWGYDAVLNANGTQVGITPNDLGREWIPKIFQAAVNGKSLRGIAYMLRGVPSPQKNQIWGEQALRLMLMNTTYCGAMTSNPNMVFEPLVSVELHKQANMAVKSRASQGRGTVKNEPALVRPFCGACWGVVREGAPSGKSPMYRITKTDKFGTRAYYVCKGHGPARRSCGGGAIRMAVLDDAVEWIMSHDNRPHMHLEFTAGDDNSERRAILDEKIRVAQEAGDYQLMIQLGQEIMAIPPSKRKAVVGLVPSGLTVGQHWQTLSPAEKRDELGRYEVLASRESVRILGLKKPGETVIADAIKDGGE